jgi:hypothetical protein
VYLRENGLIAERSFAQREHLIGMIAQTIRLHIPHSRFERSRRIGDGLKAVSTGSAGQVVGELADLAAPVERDRFA